MRLSTVEQSIWREAEECREKAQAYLDKRGVDADNRGGARQAVEDELRKVLITQTWLLKRDGFPGFDPRYDTRAIPPSCCRSRRFRRSTRSLTSMWPA